MQCGPLTWKQAWCPAPRRAGLPDQDMGLTHVAHEQRNALPAVPLPGRSCRPCRRPISCPMSPRRECRLYTSRTGRRRCLDSPRDTVFLWPQDKYQAHPHACRLVPARNLETPSSFESLASVLSRLVVAYPIGSSAQQSPKRTDHYAARNPIESPPQPNMLVTIILHRLRNVNAKTQPFKMGIFGPFTGILVKSATHLDDEGVNTGGG